MGTWGCRGHWESSFQNLSSLLVVSRGWDSGSGPPWRQATRGYVISAGNLKTMIQSIKHKYKTIRSKPKIQVAFSQATLDNVNDKTSFLTQGAWLSLLACYRPQWPSSVEFLSKVIMKEGADLAKWSNSVSEKLRMRVPKWNKSTQAECQITSVLCLELFPGQRLVSLRGETEWRSKEASLDSNLCCVIYQGYLGQLPEVLGLKSSSITWG